MFVSETFQDRPCHGAKFINTSLLHECTVRTQCGFWVLGYLCCAQNDVKSSCNKTKGPVTYICRKKLVVSSLARVPSTSINSIEYLYYTSHAPVSDHCAIKKWYFFARIHWVYIYMFAICTKFPGLCTQHLVVLMLTVDSTSIALWDVVKTSGWHGKQVSSCEALGTKLTCPYLYTWYHMFQ